MARHFADCRYKKQIIRLDGEGGIFERVGLLHLEDWQSADLPAGRDQVSRK